MGRFKKGTQGDESQTIFMPIQKASDGKPAEAIVVNKDTQGNESQTIFMPIQQTSDAKTAEAIVVNKENSEKDKVDVKDIKIVEK